MLAIVDLHRELKQGVCTEKVLATIASWMGPSWRSGSTRAPTLSTRAMSHEPNSQTFRAPTPTPGKWIEATVNQSGIRLTLYSRASTLTVQLRSETKDGSSAGSASLSKVAAKDSFGNHRRFHGFRILRDQDVASLIKSGQTGILCLWSPHKAISILGPRQMKIAARQQNVPLYAILEPTSSPEATARVARQLGLHRVQVLYFDSFDLQNRGFRLHFPSLLVFDSVGFASQVRRGFEESDVYAEYIKFHLHRS